MNVTSTGNVTLDPVAAAPTAGDLPAGLIAGVGAGSVMVLGSIIAAATADTRAYAGADRWLLVDGAPVRAGEAEHRRRGGHR